MQKDATKIIEIIPAPIPLASYGAQVVIAIQGGVPYVEEIPSGVKVIIKDYDVEGLDKTEEADRIESDENGEYLCRVFE